MILSNNSWNMFVWGGGGGGYNVNPINEIM